eukprot:1150870-Pelagomonas_calceolata.AAC.6
MDGPWAGWEPPDPDPPSITLLPTPPSALPAWAPHLLRFPLMPPRDEPTCPVVMCVVSMCPLLTCLASPSCRQPCPMACVPTLPSSRALPCASRVPEPKLALPAPESGTPAAWSEEFA